MKEPQPKDSVPAAQPRPAPERPSHLVSLAWGLAWGALGTAPIWLGNRDSFALLNWLACLAPAAGAFLGGSGIDPLRFGAVAPGAWAVGLALVGAADERASLPTPIWGALAFGGLFFTGMAIGRFTRATATAAPALLLVSALLVGLPARAGIAGEPWPPRAAAALLDLSPFVFLGECSGARDMAWHRSLYGPAGTDRFQRAPWNAPAAGAVALALGLGLALLADRRARRAPID